MQTRRVPHAFARWVALLVLVAFVAGLLVCVGCAAKRNPKPGEKPKPTYDPRTRGLPTPAQNAQPRPGGGPPTNTNQLPPGAPPGK